MRRNRDEEARRRLIHTLDEFEDADELRERGIVLGHNQRYWMFSAGVSTKGGNHLL
jgi:hypothetical protein